VESEVDWRVVRSPPAHLALLNYLTYDFLEHGTSIKRLVRTILTSKDYRSQLSIPDATLADRLALSRSTPIRPEGIRDNLLSIVGKLRADAPGNHELENGYWRYRDPWRTE